MISSEERDASFKIWERPAMTCTDPRPWVTSGGAISIEASCRPGGHVSGHVTGTVKAGFRFYDKILL